MRQIVVVSLIALAACSRPAGTPDNNQTAANIASAAPTPAAPGADQIAARTVAQEYLTHIGKRDYAAAHALWDQNGAASGGSVADLKKSYADYGTFAGRAGEVSAISGTSGQDHVVVTVDADSVMKSTGAKRDLSGFIYLRRADAHAPWRIWGVDIRRRH